MSTTTSSMPMKGLRSSVRRQFEYPCRSERGKSASSTFEPSSGGMGIKLKRQSMTLTTTIRKKKGKRSAEMPNRMINENKSAMTAFENGPAPATIASENLPGRRLYGLYGTGFA